MYLQDGVEKDEKGQVKERFVSLSLNSKDEEESPDKCFVHLKIAVYTWIGSVAQEPLEIARREDS
jgi:hypothetical protein